VQISRTALRAGQRVEVRDEEWVVLSHDVFEHAALVTLRGVGDDNLGETQRLLTPFDRIRPLDESTAIHRASRATVLAMAAAALADSPPWRECWTAAASRIDLHAWQLEPALAAIDGESRILLGDEVGLGKTIEAGLIVAELTARALAERVLILTPASLRHQWSSELSAKFGITATIFDHSSLTTTSAVVPPDVNPWRTAPVIVSSIDLVKRPEVRAALEEVPIDILLVDEAHHLTPGSDRAAVVSELAARTPWVVLATATPHSGDEAAYRFLCGLGSGDDMRPPAIFRRSRSEVGTALQRRVHLFSVEPTAEERELLDATLAYARLLWRTPADAGIHLVASVIARRAASSAAAAHHTLRRRLGLLGESSPALAQPWLPWDEGDAGDDAVSDDLLGVPGLAIRAEEVRWLQWLVDLAAAASFRSSKLGVIRRLVQRTTEPLIIFSEFRDVVLSVATDIADLASVVVIHGGLSGSTRRDLIAAFTGGTARVLVTTDTAGEGLNLHERCRLVVNLELPWNPLRLEQRIGRVDRLGQHRRVHAIHLFHRGSFEDVVLANLERRRVRASAVAPRPARVAPAIAAEAERRLRAVVTGPRSSRTAAAVYARRGPGRRRATSVVMLFRADILDGSGRIVQHEPIALHIALNAARDRFRQLSKMLVASLTGSPGVRDALDRELARRLWRARSDASKTALAIDRRMRQVLDELDRQHGEPLVQGSLFDRRSEQQSRARGAAIRIQQERCERRLAAARSLTSLSARRPRLIAAWPLD
jgi:superfamily II DNA or RNA helicase